MDALLTRPLVETAVAAAPLAGEVDSGDRSVLASTSSGILVGVVDGLGHGEEAATAAKRAESVLLSDPSESVTSLVRRCHLELRATRGAVLSLASIDALEGLMTWLGVGNVAGILVRADHRTRPPVESLVLRAGVLGARLPPLQAAMLSIRPGDLLVFATDGIRADFQTELTAETALPAGAALQPLADRILSRYATGSDDALALVVRYVGSGP